MGINGASKCAAVIKGAAFQNDLCLRKSLSSYPISYIAVVIRKVSGTIFYRTAAHDKTTDIRNIYAAASAIGSCDRASFDQTIVHLKFGFVFDDDCTAIFSCLTVLDGTAVHNESTAAAYINCTAVITSPAVLNCTAVHNELTVGFQIYGSTVSTVLIDYLFIAVYDTATLHGQNTALNENAAVFFLSIDLATGTAVLYRQVPVFPHPDYTRIFRTTAQGMSVQIQGHGAFHIQFPSGFNIAAKLDLSTIRIIQRRRQLCFVSDGGCIGSEGRSRRHRHQRQQHTQREQDCQQLCLKRFILHSLNFLS